MYYLAWGLREILCKYFWFGHTKNEKIPPHGRESVVVIWATAIFHSGVLIPQIGCLKGSVTHYTVNKNGLDNKNFASNIFFTPKIHFDLVKAKANYSAFRSLRCAISMCFGACGILLTSTFCFISTPKHQLSCNTR